MRDPVTDEPVVDVMRLREAPVPDRIESMVLDGPPSSYLLKAVLANAFTAEVIDVEARLDMLEAKLDRLIQALRAGAIGQWGNG